MRWRPLTWFLVSLLCLVGALYFWLLGNQWEANKKSAPAAQPARARLPSSLAGKQAQPPAAAPLVLLTQPAARPATPANAGNSTNRLAYRLSNTTKSAGQLLRNDRAILLANAIFDTAQPVSVSIPEHLRAQGDPGSYIVQSRRPLDDAFRAQLAAAGAAIVSYVPNDAYLVRVSADGAEQLAASPLTQTVLPYEPYYKLQSSLLGLAVENQPLPAGATLNVLLFADAAETTTAALKQLGAEIIGGDKSPFGLVLRVRPEAGSLPALAGLPGVQTIERARERKAANDLSRVRLGISPDTTSGVTNDYLGLTGTHVLVNVNDSWQFTSASNLPPENPDLAGRVFTVPGTFLVDSNGHATHVAGIIASSGSNSPANSMDTNGVYLIPGSVTNADFRGKAPFASIFALPVILGSGEINAAGAPPISDAYLQETAAQTNVLISANSWIYAGDYSYGLAAANYDAAVRDALPAVPGSQSILYVFPAGNDANTGSGTSTDNGDGGDADTIESPGTAKNVITVGAIEQPRNIANAIVLCTPTLDTNGAPVLDTNGVPVMNCTTNTPWQGRTDSDSQVAIYSSRGNVGIGTEGDFGRFKPDLVAPGEFVVSTRSPAWDQAAYYNPTNHSVTTFTNLTVNTNALFINALTLPDNAVQFIISVAPNANSPVPFPTNGFPIYANNTRLPTTADTPVDTNSAFIPPDGGLTLDPQSPGWYYAVGNATAQAASFDLAVDIVTTNDNGNYLQVLSNLNNTLGPYYRYESGTSMSAAGAAGTLALMEEFFEQRLQPLYSTNSRPSPALMKALLINGARSLGGPYFLTVTNTINYQGWGLVSLPTALPAVLSNVVTQPLGPASMIFFDQSPTNALATGDSMTRLVSVSTNAQGLPLRVTLVWTDPPGNPAVGVKLVNDLDLVVTNLDTGDFYFGNDIPPGSDYNFPYDTNEFAGMAPANIDAINNVENVYLRAPLGTNYAVAVIGHRVNVNAVTAQTNNVVQDYALVISSGNGEITNALTVTNAAIVSTNVPFLTVITNEFVGSSNVSGSLLLNQRVGANSPLLVTNTVALGSGTAWGTNGMITLGATNQWNFYVITNTTPSNAPAAFTNAAFVTFLPPELAIPRLGVRATNLDNATRPEADIDLYVSTNSALTNLDPVAIASADKSLGRGGTEYIVYSNAAPGEVYYIGVKSEDQMAAQYDFLGVFSLLPFSQNQNGTNIVQGLPLPAAIPDGSPKDPGATTILGLCIDSVRVRRVVVTNSITHENFGDLLGNLSHGDKFAVLNNHDSLGFVDATFIYEDNGEGDIPGSIGTDGPGSLRDFIGEDGIGVWLLTMVDNSLTQTGRVDGFSLRLEPEPDLSKGVVVVETIQPNSFGGIYSVDVPVGATKLTVCVENLTAATNYPNAGPVILFVRYGDVPTLTNYDRVVTNYPIPPPGPQIPSCISISSSDLPPLQPGLYFIRVYNPNGTEQTVEITATVSGAAIVPVTFNSAGPTPILDDAVTYSTNTVTTQGIIEETEVAVRIDHPRVSDLAVTLISPQGTRVLLSENRGGEDPNGMGGTLIITNVLPVSYRGGPAPVTNTIETGLTEGTVTINYNMYTIPDSMDVYYQGTNIFSTSAFSTNSGLISGAGTFTVAYGPGTDTFLRIVMNQLGNPNTNTAWTYSVSSLSSNYSYLVFTEDTNRTTTPIKFAPLPFAPSTILSNIFSDGFETTAVGTYGQGIPFTSETLSWTVTTNQVVVTNNPVGNGGSSNFLALTSGGVSTLLPTVAGQRYILSYALGTEPGGGTNDASTNGADWQPRSLTFVASTNGTSLSLLSPGVTNGVPTELVLNFGANALLDDFTLAEMPGDLYYLPEESLDTLAGERALGDWRLEILDNRVGATNTAPALINWELRFIFQNTVPAPAALIQGAPQTNSVPPGGTAFYAVCVPPWASFATNTLLFADGPVNLLFNQMNPPTNGSGDVALITSTLGGSVTLATNGTPPLLPGATYYLGVQNTNAVSVNYALQVVFDITALTNGVSYPGTLDTCSGVRYFSYNVSTSATAVSFQLLNLTGNAQLVARKGAPLPTLTSYDYGSFNPGSDPEQIIIFTNSTPVALSSGVWYLGAFDADVGNVNYRIIATEYTNLFSNVITLTNGIPYFNTNSGIANTNDYYHYVVRTNAVRAQFEINNPSANVVLVARRGLPLPDLSSFDFSSTNVYTNDQLIVLFNYSTPVPLIPGDWFLTAVNVSGGPASYAIKATDWPAYGTNIVITNHTFSSGSFCITWTSLPGVHYYVQGRTNLTDTNWITASPTITAAGYSTTYCIPLPSPLHFFRVTEGLVLSAFVPSANSVLPGQIAYIPVDVPAWASFATNTLVTASGSLNVLFNPTNPPGTNAGDFILLTNVTSGFVTLGTNGTPPLTPGQRYWLGLQNTNAVTVNYTFQVDFDITALSNGVPVTSALAAGPPARYFSYNVSSNATAVSFTLTNLSGNAQLVARYGAPLPTLGSFDYSSFNPGSNDEAIIIFTNSAPVALTNGVWYLGVFNVDVTNVAYTILAVEYTNPLPDIITLTNGIPYFNTNAGVASTIDYYHYAVTTNALRAQFEIDNPTANVVLVARRGLPLPDLGSFDYRSANAYTNDQLIMLFNYSTPVPLTPGDWFLSAINISGGPAAYAIKATEWPAYGTNIAITGISAGGSSFCVTWTSLPGAYYYLLGLANVTDTNWVAASPTITATNSSTTYCVPLPSPLHFFRVVEGIAVGSYVPQPAFSSITRTNGGILLQWRGPLNAQDQVRWTPTLVPPAWTSFTNIITSTNGLFSFLDDGSQAGGLGGTRFYQLLQLP